MAGKEQNLWAKCLRANIMAFTRISIESDTPGTQSTASPQSDTWAVFRALRNARSFFGLRPGHIQTLQAMLSFLKPGHGDTVFASNNSLCERIGGIDERTLRRHINRLVECGFIRRHDSSNGKRYRVRSSDGECVSFGLCLTPLLERANELITLAENIENERRDKMFLRKQILAKLAHLEDHDPQNSFLNETRKILRRKLTVGEYRALLKTTDVECKTVTALAKGPNTLQLPANDGQTVRHQSTSNKDRKDLEGDTNSTTPPPQLLTSVCDQAMSFASQKLVSWMDIENHARTLAPMMGIHAYAFEKAKNAIGAQKASCAIFIILQLGNSVKDFGAYFHAITLGKRQKQFDPCTFLERLSKRPHALP
jgi:replication initiation protein RepC